MDFTVSDMPSAPSGPAVDGGVKSARATTAPSSNGSRKSFSTVLQTVRGEDERGDAREAGDARSVHKSDDGSPLKETKGLNASSAKTKGTETSSSQATDESRSSDHERNTEVSKTDVESTGQETHAASDAQGQAPAPLLTIVAVQTAPEAIDQTKVRAEEGIHTKEKVDVGEDAHAGGHDTEPSGESSPPPLISVAATGSPVTDSHPSAQPSSQTMASSPSPNLPEQAPDASAIQPTHDSPVAQVTTQTPHVVADDTGSAVADLPENHPMPMESQPGTALPQSDSVVRRAFHAYLGAISSNGKSETAKPDSVKLEAVSRDHSATTQVTWYGQSLGNPENMEARTQWTFPHGQQSGLEMGEHFNKLWADQDMPHLDHVVVKLPQAAVVDLGVANGQSAGLMAAGVQAHSGSGPTPSPSTTSFVSQPPPAMPAHDAMEHSARLMTRSVVLDLAQPDLGHVNVRVAMMNDVVHTHLSADRPEVGQYLMNGQDRFQAVLQTNGLEMGQFRVDIDRQGAGRSFQQGQFQEQGYAWNQGSHDMEHEHGHDGRDEPRMSLHGLLNLVA